ncbi:MAG TPA: hypothetical protein VN698_12360 [Bacteroidia bacterium]|nr:hypothetical protein [Bacteroidia bacterium]
METTKPTQEKTPTVQEVAQSIYICLRSIVGTADEHDVRKVGIEFLANKAATADILEQTVTDLQTTISSQLEIIKSLEEQLQQSKK